MVVIWADRLAATLKQSLKGREFPETPSFRSGIFFIWAFYREQHMALNKPVQDSWRTQTLAVRGGTRRSEFGETGEAIFATSGFVYENAEQAENAFQSVQDRFLKRRTFPFLT